MTADEALQAKEAWLEDLSVRLITVISRDRFGDFVSDQVVAPVRESSAQALGAVVDLMSDAKVELVAEILVKMLDADDWQCRHGGLLGVRRNHLQSLCTEIQKKLFSDQVPPGYPL